MFLGAASVLSNGTVLSRVGTAAVALMAAAQRVPGAWRGCVCMGGAGSCARRSACLLRQAGAGAGQDDMVGQLGPGQNHLLTCGRIAFFPTHQCNTTAVLVGCEARKFQKHCPTTWHLVLFSSHPAVLVCCETYKFHERVQLDSITHNEVMEPDVLAQVRVITCWLSY